MFLLSFVLEDWALHELLPLERQREVATLLVASSYVTWTYQMHTFSNSIETLIVLWCAVLMKRMKADAAHTQVRLCTVLGFLGVLGVFNRITFPAFLIVPALELIPHLLNKPVRIAIILSAAAFTTLIAVAMDTEHYTGRRLHLRQIISTAVFTPWNNAAYNLDSANLAQHGLHPYYQHFLANLPQLLGPAVPLLLFSCRRDTLFWSGITGIALLSCFQHQEARFLLPAVPLILASVKLPTRFTRAWVGIWIACNVLAGIVFGSYHQAGVVPVQTWVSQQPDVTRVLWWKTYSPPGWLLGRENARVTTEDLMGMPYLGMIERVVEVATCRLDGGGEKMLLVAPTSAEMRSASAEGLVFERVHEQRRHVGLDDLDFGDGVWAEVKRVVGRRGLSVWEVTKEC